MHPPIGELSAGAGGGPEEGTGRVAALVHTSPDGKTDLPLPANVRVYFMAGTQHTPSAFPAEITNLPSSKWTPWLHGD